MYLLYLPLFLVFYVLTHHLLIRKLQNHPPSPFPSLPLIGHLYLLKRSFHRSLSTLSDRYGPVLFLWFGYRHVLLVSSPSAAEECFTKNDIVFANRPRFLVGKHLGNNYTSIAWAPYGDHWRNLRRISSLEILSSHRLELLSHIRVDEVRSLIRRLSRVSAAQPRPVELKSALVELTFNVVMRMIAGKRYYGEDVGNTDEARRFQEIVSETSRVGAESAIADFLPFMRWFGIKGIEKRLMALQKKWDKLLQDLIEGHRQIRSDAAGGRKKTVIDILFSLQEADPHYYTDDTVRSLVKVLFQAGTEASAGTMEWAMFNLLNNPQVLKKAQAEIDNRKGQYHLIDESDLGELPYLQSIIYETLRKHPPTPLLIPHESSNECMVRGFRIPRGTMLLVNLWGIQNDPKVWAGPEKFKPERFEGVEGSKEGLKWMAFGSGRRGCPGERLGMRMVGLVLGSLLQCFYWERIGEEMVDMTEGRGATVSMANPLMAKCRSRPTFLDLLSNLK